METITLNIILLSCLIFFASNANAVQTSNTFVLDTSGKPLRSGTFYRISPGLTLGDPRNKTCPLDVVQSTHSRGLAVSFSRVDAKRGAIRLSSDLNVKFLAKARACARSTVWRLDNFDEGLAQWFVTTGGVEGNPGVETVSNWFKIEKYDDDKYKVVFCPTVCKFCKVMCRDVGVFVRDGVGRLGLSDVPLLLSFNKY